MNISDVNARAAAKLDDDSDLPDVDAVELGGTPQARINYLSVSQLKTARACRRKWWLGKVAGIKEPEKASLIIGKQVHAQLEHYLKTGEDVLGEIARAALKYLPPPKTPGVQLEAKIANAKSTPIMSYVTADGIPLVGFIDRADSRVPFFPAVTDYKTTKDLKWASKPETLTTTLEDHGIQMVGYALAEFEIMPQAIACDLEHLTLSKTATKKQRAAGEDVKQTLASITPKKARDEWERMNLLAREIRKVATIAKVEDVPSAWGTDACSAYGGCFYFGTCLVAEASRSRNPQPQTEKPKMSLKAALEARRKAAAGAANPDTFTATSAANPPKADESTQIHDPARSMKRS